MVSLALIGLLHAAFPRQVVDVGREQVDLLFGEQICVGRHLVDATRADLRLDLEIGDSILLCSDGLTKHVEDESIARVLADAEDAQSACDTLVDAANAAGGTDNITVVIGRCGPEE